MQNLRNPKPESPTAGSVAYSAMLAFNNLAAQIEYVDALITLAASSSLLEEADKSAFLGARRLVSGLLVDAREQESLFDIWQSGLRSGGQMDMPAKI